MLYYICTVVLSQSLSNNSMTVIWAHFFTVMLETWNTILIDITITHADFNLILLLVLQWFFQVHVILFWIQITSNLMPAISVIDQKCSFLFFLCVLFSFFLFSFLFFKNTLRVKSTFHFSPRWGSSHGILCWGGLL